MTCCATIEICNQELLDAAPRHLLINGRLLLNTAINLTKKREELNEFGTIKGEGALSISIQYNDLTNFLFSSYFRVTEYNNNFDDIEIQVSVKGKVLQFNKLRVLSKDDNSKQYDFQLIQGNLHWKDAAANCPICEGVDYGKFTFTQIEMVQNWQSEALYDIGKLGYFLGVVDYGGSDQFGGVHLDTLRPLFHKYKLAKDLLCKIGWNFVSPVWETEWGRRQVAHLTDNLGSLSDPKKFGFRVEMENGDSNVGQNLVWSTIVRNNGDYVNTQVNGKHQGGQNLSGQYIICLCIEVSGSSANLPVDFTLYIRAGSEGVTSRVFSYPGTGIQTYCIEYGADLTEGLNSVNAQINLISNPTGPTPALLFFTNNSYLESKASSVCIKYGQTIEVSNFLSSAISLEQLLAGMVHDVSGLIVTDYNTKTVHLYSPYDENVFGEETEGFYKPEIKDLKGVICKSLKAITPNGKALRYCVLGYKESSDNLIQSSGYGKTNPLHGRVVDLGNSLTEGYKYNLNPLFEPTLDKALNHSQGITIPVMWDNDGGETPSKNIGPRQLTAIGYVKQTYTDENGNIIDKVLNQIATNFENPNPVFSNSEFFGYVSHCPIPTIDVVGSRSPVFHNVYGSKANDQFIFWDEVIRQQQFGISHNYLAYISIAEYCNLDFRTRYCLQYGGVKYFYRLSEISDFEPCSGISTPITLEPELNREKCSAEFAEQNTIVFTKQCCVHYYMFSELTQAQAATARVPFFRVNGANILPVSVINPSIGQPIPQPITFSPDIEVPGSTNAGNTLFINPSVINSLNLISNGLISFDTASYQDYQDCFNSIGSLGQIGAFKITTDLSVQSFIVIITTDYGAYKYTQNGLFIFSNGQYVDADQVLGTANLIDNGPCNCKMI